MEDKTNETAAAPVVDAAAAGAEGKAEADRLLQQAAENAAASTAFNKWPKVVQLTKKVKAHGDEVDRLSFREPSGGDIETVGNPVLMDFLHNQVTPQVKFDARVMTAMMCHLAAVPPSTIRTMSGRDWNSCAWVLAPFFMPEL